MRGTEDPVRLALAHAQGALADAARLLKRCPDTSAMVATIRQLGKELGARLDGMPLQTPLRLTAEPSPVSAGRAEFDWRVQEVEKAHMRAYQQFKRANAGLHLNGHGPLPDAVRRLIRDAIREYDAGLLGPDQREEWTRESRVRAAGIGIFYSPWHTGIFTDLPPGEKPRDWSGPYLEHDRPWRRRAGKADPILAFAQKYFEARALAEGGES